MADLEQKKLKWTNTNRIPKALKWQDFIELELKKRIMFLLIQQKREILWLTAQTLMVIQMLSAS